LLGQRELLIGILQRMPIWLPASIVRTLTMQRALNVKKNKMEVIVLIIIGGVVVYLFKNKKKKVVKKTTKTKPAPPQEEEKVISKKDIKKMR
jgi:hypothetical protein